MFMEDGVGHTGADKMCTLHGGTPDVEATAETNKEPNGVVLRDAYSIKTQGEHQGKEKKR